MQVEEIEEWEECWKEAAILVQDTLAVRSLKSAPKHSRKLHDSPKYGIRRNPAESGRFSETQQSFPSTKALLSATMALSSVIVNRQSGEMSNSD